MDIPIMQNAKAILFFFIRCKMYATNIAKIAKGCIIINRNTRWMN